MGVLIIKLGERGSSQEILGSILLIVGIIGALMFASQFSAIINNQPWNEGILALGAILAGLGLAAGGILIKGRS